MLRQSCENKKNEDRVIPAYSDLIGEQSGRAVCLTRRCRTESLKKKKKTAEKELPGKSEQVSVKLSWHFSDCSFYIFTFRLMSAL